jgi:hypothetical protein
MVPLFKLRDKWRITAALPLGTIAALPTRFA